jgi:outer membrane protein assembly factor BamB
MTDMRFLPRWIVVAGVLSTLAFLGVSTCQAQQVRFSVGIQQNMSRFIPPPRSLNQLLKDAEEALKEDRMSEAVVVLGDLLERSTDLGEDPALLGQDFFLDVTDSDQQRVDRSFFRRCRELIGELPEDARETYELRYGPLAKQLLEQATEQRDWSQLREVRRKYFHTVAGYQASLLLAQQEMYEGHPLAASLLLDDVIASPGAVDRLGQAAVLMHAVACRLAGREIPELPERLDASVALAGEPIAEGVTNWRKWIDDQFAYEQVDSISRSKDYPFLGGDPARNDTAEGQLPLSVPRWMLETTATPREEKLLREISSELAAMGRLAPPSWSPIRVGGQLLMRTTERLRGVDYRTGKRVWQYPWFDTDDSLEDDESISSGSRDELDADELLGRRVWNDVPYGQISSDGERVFLLDDLAPLQTVNINPLMGIRSASSADSGRNTLVALDLASEGKILWRVGQDPTVESELNDAFFLGPPLAVDGSLYALVEMSGDISLVCLDPATGKLQWQQQLVAIEGLGIQYVGIRRISGATPSYHEGVLICPTGAGATVAVDLADRTLRWGNSYRRRADVSNVSRFRRTEQSTDELLERWHSSLAIASGSVIVVTPAATDVLFCYDLVDGKSRFSKPRQSAFYVAGIRDGSLLMVGPREVISYDVKSGRLNWKADRELVNSGDQIVGRGVFSKDRYIVPTSGNELVSISLDDGTVKERRTTRFPLGNLVAIDGEIISQSATRLAVALGAETLGPRVERMLKENPDDLDALIQKALLLSQQGERKQALVVLERAREIDPDSDDVRMLSISSMLGMLREGEDSSPELIAELDALIDTPGQRLEFLALRIQSALDADQVAEATGLLLQFTSVMSEVSLVGDEVESIVRDPGRDCSIGSWVAARSAEIVRKATARENVESVRDQVSKFVAAEAINSTKRLEAFVRNLRPLGIDDVVVTLAERKAAEEDWFSAERTLIGPIRPDRILNQSTAILSANQAAALARVYAQGQLGEDAEAVLAPFRSQDSSSSLPETVVEELSDLAAKSIGGGFPDLEVTDEVQLTWQSQALPPGARASFAQRISKPTIQAGKSFAGWSIVNNSGAVALLNPIGESSRLTYDSFQQSGVSDRQAIVSGGLLVLEKPGEISVLDLFAVRNNQSADAMLWSRDFSSDRSPSRKAARTEFGDTIYSYPTNSSAANLISEFRVGPVLGDRMLLLLSGELICLNATDGESLWRNSQAPPIGHMVAEEGRLAVVSFQPNRISEINEFDLLDGRKLGTRPWEYGNVWASSGKHILAYQSAANGASATVRLVDPFRDEVVLEIESAIKHPRAEGAKRGLGRVIQDRFLVLFDQDGRLVIWDLLRGTELCRHETSEMTELESMHAMWMDNQLLVLPANKIVRRNQFDYVTQHGDTHRSLHKIIAVSTETGEINWQRDFDVPWGTTLSQPSGTPVILLARFKTTHMANRSPIPRIDVQMLRLSDGKTVHEELEHAVPARSNGLMTTLVVQPGLGQILARIEGEFLKYQFKADSPLGDPPSLPTER